MCVYIYIYIYIYMRIALLVVLAARTPQAKPQVSCCYHVLLLVLPLFVCYRFLLLVLFHFYCFVAITFYCLFAITPNVIVLPLFVVPPPRPRI